MDTEGRRAEPGAESFAGCRSRALSHTGSVLDTLTWAQWQQELSLLAVAWAETSFLLPPAMGLQWAPEVTNPTKAQGKRGFAPAQEVLQGCSWKQRMSRALQRVLSKPKIRSGVWDQDTAGVE